MHRIILSVICVLALLGVFGPSDQVTAASTASATQDVVAALGEFFHHITLSFER
jgi:hypothetical protein